jgi:two-component system phosphate regulon sensor histidine kinase PhoR
MNSMAEELRGRIETISQQQSQLTAMFSSMTEGILLLDSEGRVVQINQSAERILAVTLHEALGTHIYEIIRQPELLRFIESLMEGNSVVEADLETHIAGAAQVIRARGQAILDTERARIGGLITLYNLTRLTRLESMRRDFVANVSHELKTPVTAISVATDTLSDGALEDPEMASKFLGTIKEHTKRLNKLIDDLLALGRIEEEVKHEAIQLKRTALRPTIEAALEECEGQAQGKHVSMRLECDRELEVWQNRKLLREALVQLVDNAVRHSVAGTEVRVEVMQNDADRVLLRVHDNGPGIPPEHQERIFERFYRVDNARSRQAGGTGLGLALVKYIALAHHGHADVESTVGEGSTFTMTLHCGRNL